MKNYIINTTNLQKGGALQVAYSFIDECSKYNKIKFHIFLGIASKEILLNNTFSNFKNLHFYTVNFHPSKSFFSLFRYLFRLYNLERSIKPDGVISVFGPCYWKPKTKHIIGFANGYFLYTDSPFIINNKLNSNFNFLIKKFIHRILLRIEADFYWTETFDSKIRLSKYLNINLNKIIVASNCPNSSFYTNFKHDDISEIKNKKIIILYISSFYPHKNFEFIPLVYAALLSKGFHCEFQITISNSEYNSIKSLQMCPGIVNLGIIHPNQCVNLYNSCDIVFVPSLLEIFTAVYPEAMASGKPIVTNNLSFAKSICGDAALYYDYSSAEDASLKIIELIENNNLRLNLINNGLKRLSFFDTSESRFSKILQTLK